jgi:uncharacterized protein (TIGR03067 family)
MRRGAVSLAILFSSVAAALGSAASDLDALQGQWQLVRGIRDGVEAAEAQVRGTVIEFRGHEFRFPNDAQIGTSRSGRFRLDTTVTPHRIDAVAAGDGAVSRGIYSISGDDYRVVFSAPGHPRPTAFTSEPGSGKLLQLWRRIPAAGD